MYREKARKPINHEIRTMCFGPFSQGLLALPLWQGCGADQGPCLDPTSQTGASQPRDGIFCPDPIPRLAGLADVPPAEQLARDGVLAALAQEAPCGPAGDPV